MGEVGGTVKESGDRTSSDADEQAEVKLNGEVNGVLDEPMEVEDSPVKSAANDAIMTNQSLLESKAGEEEEDDNEDGEDMDTDEVANNLAVKNEVLQNSDKSNDELGDSVKNGPTTQKNIVNDLMNNSDSNSDKSDDSEEVKVENNVGGSDHEGSDHVNDHSSDRGDFDDDQLDKAGNLSDSAVSESSDKQRTLQNGDLTEGSDVEGSKAKSKDSSDDNNTSAVTTPVSDKDGGKPESEESPDNEDGTPKKGKNRKNPAPLSLTPRRSSRNLNKQKSYAEDKEDAQDREDNSDIEEIALVDPLAGPSDSMRENKENSKARNSRNSINKTIVVNDTKHLVEIASGSKQTKGLKKEPTLVIIDTNSILSGRGPVPMQNKLPQRSGLQITPAHMSSTSSSIQQSFSVLPVGTHSQPVFSGGMSAQRVSTPPAPPAPVKPPVILPSLTDDMYVVEAPSFIVPYVYEKPPIKPLKDFLENLQEAIKKLREEEEERRKKEEEEEKKNLEKESTENEEEEEEDDSENEKTKKNDEKSDENEEKEDDKEKEKDADCADETTKDKDDTALRESIKKESSDELPKSDSDAPKIEITKSPEDLKKPASYFDNPLGKFFMQIGVNLVQEHVQTDLLRAQKKKRDREGNKKGTSTQMAISSLQQTLEYSKENNEPFHLKQKKCDYCSFKTESALVMAHHMETPHMRNYIYRCNFCTLEVRSPHDILFHMEAEHNVRGRLERGPAFHQCPNCPFEDNQKGKLTRHLVSCQKKYRPEKNQEPPLDWEPPAKIPRLVRNRPFPMPGQSVTMPGIQKNPLVGQQHPLLPKLPTGSTMVGQPTLGQVANSLGRGRGRPPMQSRFVSDLKQAQALQQQQLQRPMAGMLYRSSQSSSQPQVLVPNSYQIAGNQIYQNSKGQTNKIQQQPSISITPLPRQPTGTPPLAHNSSMSVSVNKPGHPSSGGKATFVICEICDGYIKDLEQLRNHMQWIHKVKIHPKMIYNRPPLNCQKCQFRFFTDQGLERHLLGSHGLVTSSMQEAANKGKDGGRCPVCGRVYQWKLLNHVARDHNMTLKPAHLSYKCTVCTATFGMYKQFENHVYSAHSVVAKRVMDKKPGGSGSSSVTRSSGQSQQGDSLLKPLKINDEITIIPQPSRSSRPMSSSRSGPLPAHLSSTQITKVGDDRPRRSGGREEDSVQIIDLDDSPAKDALSAVQERLRRRTSLEVSQVESEGDISSPPVKKSRRD